MAGSRPALLTNPHRRFFPGWWPASRRGAPSQRWTRLALEVLEDRLAPAGVASYEIAPVGPVNPGQTFSLVVTPVDAQHQRTSTGLDSITFTSSDKDAGLPGTFFFGASDTGSYTIPGFTLNTSGKQTITLHDADNSLTATTKVNVNLLAPTGLELSINVPGEAEVAPNVVFGQQFTLSGDFQNLGNVAHTVKIDWGAGPATTINLAASANSFNINHVYGSETGIGDGFGQDETISVTVSNSAGSTEVETPIFVSNLTPEVSLTPSPSAPVGSPYTATGYFISPGPGPYKVQVDYGDGTGLQTVAFDPQTCEFSLQHVYSKVGDYKVTVTVTQSDGETGQSSFTAKILPSLDLSINVPGEGEEAPNVVFGQQFNLSGTFQDDANVAHTVKIDWGAGPATTIHLAAGAFSFSVNHVYGSETGIGDGFGQDETISVTVSSSACTIRSETPIFVSNLTPEVSLTPSLYGTVGSPYTATGYFISPGPGPYTVQVNYGDGTGLQTVAFDPETKQFSLQHVYSKDGDYKVTVTVTQSDGEKGKSSFYAQILLAGVKQVEVVDVPPGQSATLRVGGATVTLRHSITSTEDAILLLAVIPASSVATLPNSSFLINGDLDVTSYDLRVINANLLDSAAITFGFKSNSEKVPTFTFFDASKQQAIDDSQYTVDYSNYTILTKLDDRTTPRLVDTTGTVFTITVPVDVSPSSPATSSPSISSPSTASTPTPPAEEPLSELTPQGPTEAPSNVPDSMPESVKDSTGSVGAVTGIRSLAFAEGIDGGSGVFGDSASVDSGPLSELPPVSAPLIGSPSAVISPPRVVAPPEPGPSISWLPPGAEFDLAGGTSGPKEAPLEPAPERTEEPIAPVALLEETVSSLQGNTRMEKGKSEEKTPAEEQSVSVSDAIFARMMQPPTKTSILDNGQLLFVAMALVVGRPTSPEGKRQKTKGKS